jgi:hypothetical protein
MALALSLYYVLKCVGETALSGRQRFWAASLVRTRHSRLWSVCAFFIFLDGRIKLCPKPEQP